MENKMDKKHKPQKNLRKTMRVALESTMARAANMEVKKDVSTVAPSGTW
jgi:hypothetical protein